MSFELFVQGEPDKTPNLPRKSDLMRIFDGHVIEDEAPAHPVLRIGVDEPGGWTAIYYDQGDGDPIQSSLMVERPKVDPWLWEALLTLLREYDLFMHWPAVPPLFVVARDGVPKPDDFPFEFRRIDSTAELLGLIEES